MAKQPDVKVMDYIKKWAGKKTTYEIAIDLDKSFSTIRNNAAALGISLLITENVKKTEQIKAAVKQHHSQKTLSEIAKMLNASPGTVKYHGTMQGLEFKQFDRPVKQRQVLESEYFNEGSRTNWLI